MSPGLHSDVIISPSKFCDALEKIGGVTVIHRGRKPDIRIESGMTTNIELWELVDNSRFTPRNIDWNNKVIQFRPGNHPDSPVHYIWYDHREQSILTFPNGDHFNAVEDAVSALVEAEVIPTASLSLKTIFIAEQQAAIMLDALSGPHE